MKRYTVKLTTLAPVHIGNGSKATKQEYLYNPKEQFVSFVDGSKLTKYLKEQSILDKYFNYLNTEKYPNLIGFLKVNNIHPSDWKHFISHEEPVNQGKTDGKYGKQSYTKPMNDIQLFTVDGRGDNYIPGSSLKGALRTILLKSFQEDSYNNNLFANIKISDSVPINKSCMEIYQKIDINKKDNPMPLYRECIKPKTEITFDLVIENNVVSKSEIELALDKFNENYVNKWLIGIAKTDGGLEFFQKETKFNEIYYEGDHVIYIGGGVGFASKSLHYQVYDKEIAKKEIFNELKRRFFKTYGKFKVTPNNVPIALKATADLKNNEWYQQGLCKIEIIEK